jgi:hypothetical protein
MAIRTAPKAVSKHHRGCAQPDFTYDPLYRLLSATGREWRAPPEPWDGGHATPYLARMYEERSTIQKAIGAVKHQTMADSPDRLVPTATAWP